MTKLKEELGRLLERISKADEQTCYRYQPQLTALIDRLDAAGEHVPNEVRHLEEELTNDAIEAQFDNMPV